MDPGCLNEWSGADRSTGEAADGLWSTPAARRVKLVLGRPIRRLAPPEARPGRSSPPNPRNSRTGRAPLTRHCFAGRRVPPPFFFLSSVASRVYSSATGRSQLGEAPDLEPDLFGSALTSHSRNRGMLLGLSFVVVFVFVFWRGGGTLLFPCSPPSGPCSPERTAFGERR